MTFLDKIPFLALLLFVAFPIILGMPMVVEKIHIHHLQKICTVPICLSLNRTESHTDSEGGRSIICYCKYIVNGVEYPFKWYVGPLLWKKYDLDFENTEHNNSLHLSFDGYYCAKAPKKIYVPTFHNNKTEQKALWIMLSCMSLLFLALTILKIIRMLPK